MDTILDPNMTIAMARFAIVVVWAMVFVDLWSVRKYAKANQAIAASLAMVVAEALLIFNNFFNVPAEILVFFLAMAHVTLAVSYMRVVNTSLAFPRRLLTKLAYKNCDDVPHPSVTLKFSRAIMACLVGGFIYSQVVLLFAH